MKITHSKFPTIAFVIISAAISLLSPTPILALDNNNCDPSLPEEVLAASGCSSSSTRAEEDDLPNLIINIINAVILVSGLIAVVFIIVGGIQFMTSAGDSVKTKKAKSTILYAVVGLIICALAYAIVNFVIDNMLN